MKLYLQKTSLVFFVLCITFVPFVLKDLQLQIDRFLFLRLLQFLAGSPYRITDFSSDTLLLNTLLVLLFVIALGTALFIKLRADIIIGVAKTVVVYYLAFVLLKYGIDKLFLAQFYTPEPNTLYTPFGYLSKDILYWSTMGVSPRYSIITGSIEVVIAFMLFFKRTRALGLLASIIVLVNIVIINFSFDISVKTFSLLLLAMAIYLSWANLKKLYALFILHKSYEIYAMGNFKLPIHIKKGVKFFVVGVMFLQVLYPYMNVKEPSLIVYGAYNVEKVLEDGELINLKVFPVKRVFIHKNNYIIFQHHDDTMKDYFFENNTENKMLTLYGYDGKKRMLSYFFDKKYLRLHFIDGPNVDIITKKLEFKNLPALKDDFHLTIDEVK